MSVSLFNHHSKFNKCLSLREYNKQINTVILVKELMITPKANEKVKDRPNNLEN